MEIPEIDDTTEGWNSYTRPFAEIPTEYQRDDRKASIWLLANSDKAHPNAVKGAAMNLNVIPPPDSTLLSSGSEELGDIKSHNSNFFRAMVELPNDEPVHFIDDNAKLWQGKRTHNLFRPNTSYVNTRFSTDTPITRIHENVERKVK